MSNASYRETVLVTGGTGNQGGAAIAHLLASNRVQVRVLTRNPGSSRARQLAAQGVELVRGDLDDPLAVKAALDGVSAAFSVQAIMGKGGVAAEERRGTAFADAVKAAATVHLVYSSVEGADRDSGIPHFQSKWRIEQHIRQIGLPATILRPVAFMENFSGPAFARSMTLGLFKAVLGNSKRVQLVSVADIGWFAARALEDPARFSGRIIPLAGDELNVSEIIDAYRSVTGRAPRAFTVPRFLPKVIMPADIATMFYWIGEHGFRANISALRQEHPGLLSLTSWLRGLHPTPEAKKLESSR